MANRSFNLFEISTESIVAYGMQNDWYSDDELIKYFTSDTQYVPKIKPEILSVLMKQHGVFNEITNEESDEIYRHVAS